MTEKLVFEDNPNFTYYIDIEKGVVAAVMEDPLEEATSYIDKIGKKFVQNGVSIIDSWEIIKKHLNSSIRAKATCAEEDEFNLEYGMELAKKRCLAKYYKKLTQVFVELNNSVDPLLSYIEDMIISCAGKYEHFNQYNKRDN